eukprot:g5538.t1
MKKVLLFCLSVFFLLRLHIVYCESCGDEDCYDVLKLTQRASLAEIKDAYKKLSRQYHPDKNPGASQERFKIIAAAYEILSNERRRSRYDYAIRNPDGWLDEDGNYNDEPGKLDYKIISICLIICCLFFAVSAKWVANQEFWSPPQIKKRKKKTGKKV